MFLQAVGAQAGSRILCFWGEKYIFKGARFCLKQIFLGAIKFGGTAPNALRGYGSLEASPSIF